MGATPFWWNPVAPGCQEIALDATEQQKQVNPAFTLTYGRFWILLDERMVALPGLEPGLSALRGRRVNQLHHNAIVVHPNIAPSSHNPTVRHRRAIQHCAIFAHYNIAPSSRAGGCFLQCRFNYTSGTIPTQPSRRYRAKAVSGYSIAGKYGDPSPSASSGSG